MEILNIYTMRKREELANNFEEEKKAILQADKYEIARRQCADIIDNLYKELNNGVSYYENHSKVFKWAEGKLQEKTTLEKLDELEEKFDTDLCNLEIFINEVKAQLFLCETYEQKIAVLKNYKILDKNGILTK